MIVPDALAREVDAASSWAGNSALRAYYHSLDMTKRVNASVLPPEGQDNGALARKRKSRGSGERSGRMEEDCLLEHLLDGHNGENLTGAKNREESYSERVNE